MVQREYYIDKSLFHQVKDQRNNLERNHFVFFQQARIQSCHKCCHLYLKDFHKNPYNIGHYYYKMTLKVCSLVHSVVKKNKKIQKNILFLRVVMMGD